MIEVIYYDDGEIVTGSITGWIHQSIGITTKDDTYTWIIVDQYRGETSLIYGYDLWHIAPVQLDKYVEEIRKTLEYMEEIANKLQNGEKTDINELKLNDLYHIHSYVDSGLKETIEKKCGERCDFICLPRRTSEV